MNNQTHEIESHNIESQGEASSELLLSELELLQVLGGDISDVNGPDQAGLVDSFVRFVAGQILKDMAFGSGVQGPSAPSNPSNGTHGQGGQGGGGGSGGASGR